MPIKRNSIENHGASAQTDPGRRKADLIVSAAKQHKAFDLELIDVSQLSSVADYYFICSCNSSRQVQAVADYIMGEVKHKGGFLPRGVEGVKTGQWVLIDFGEVVVHLFYEPVREFYDLEGLWAEAPRIDLEEETDRRFEKKESRL